MPHRNGDMKVVLEEPVEAEIEMTNKGKKIALEENKKSLTNGHNGQSQGQDGSCPCHDPAIIAKPSDFEMYTNGGLEADRPKKIYRVVLTGGKGK